VGDEAPDQHDPGGDDLRRQVRRAERAGENVHEDPGQHESDAGDGGEAPACLGMRPIARVGQAAIEAIRDDAARPVTEEGGRHRIESARFDEADEHPVMRGGRHDAYGHEGTHLAGQPRPIDLHVPLRPCRTPL
jgi:hypothetical protein